MKTLILLIICIPFGLQSQEAPRRVQFGIYAGAGVTLVAEKYRKGMAYELGQSTIIKKKGDFKRRMEVYLQYTEYNYVGDSRDNYYKSYEFDTTYAVSHYKSQVFNVGLKWHIPIIHRDRYRLIFAPGFAVGSLLMYKYRRSWYYFSNNQLEHEVNTKVNPTSRIMLGPHITVSQEFKLTPVMYFHLDINFMGQTNLAGSQGYSVGWGGVTIRPGFYWYLKPRKKETLNR
ncbi:hypothetical protein [Fluviicola taffensis]|uniref:Outer membrane protein beta-barrel domain-containing protein n=1 Tax=Fluviicola taffensis (strain DSM 16823 / NCIMB 13979 / RW262) TaxID=755732 RepID=F2IAT5_FLUTR|nr:hypothetical protein [Fluviicola taffensis]AEA44240.1 hypothetical protein Fluta_2254 [Fluviicola taffensis DSM 16823]